MTHGVTGGTTLERLLAHLVGILEDRALAAELELWLAGSGRFRAFADAHRDKIRKKLRTATDADARRDVRAELQVAHRLLADRRIDLAFEAYGSGRGGPDFTVTFRGERPFNLEVTRLRGAPSTSALSASLLAKLRQLPPSVPNVVLVAVEAAPADPDAIEMAIRSLRARADARDAVLLERGRFEGPRAFYERFLRLGAVVIWAEAAEGEGRVTAWTSASTRIAVPERGLRACLAALRA